MYHELGRGPAYLPALSCQTSPDLGSTVGSALGEGHRQAGAWTEAVTMCGGVRDPEKRAAQPGGGPVGDLIALSVGLSWDKGSRAEQGQRTLGEPEEDRIVATR